MLPIQSKIDCLLTALDLYSCADSAKNAEFLNDTAGEYRERLLAFCDAVKAALETARSLDAGDGHKGRRQAEMAADVLREAYAVAFLD